MVDHAQPWLNFALGMRLSQNKNQPLSTMVRHVYFRVFNIYVMVYIPWVNPLCLFL